MENNNENMLITNAVYVSDYKVNITFADETEKEIDFGIFLKSHPHPQHNKYLDFLKNLRNLKLKAEILFGEKNRI